MRAKDVMTSPVITVRPDTAIKEAAGLLVDKRVSALPVVKDQGELVGIVSEADLVRLETEPDPRRHLIPQHYEKKTIPRVVGEVMTRDVVAVEEDTDVALVARLMLERRLKSIPVVVGNEVVGIIARRDVLRVLARSDTEIHVELEDLLDDELVMMGRYRAQVSDGIVTLFGPTDRASRRLAELLARSVPGVLDVRFAAAPARAAEPAPIGTSS
jgi:CBS domain-containing protein